MAYSSFSQFLTALEKAGELKRISVPVATELEEKLQRAIGAKDWELVKKLSAELAVAQPPKAG